MPQISDSACGQIPGSFLCMRGHVTSPDLKLTCSPAVNNAWRDCASLSCASLSCVTAPKCAE